MVRVLASFRLHTGLRLSESFFTHAHTHRLNAHLSLYEQQFSKPLFKGQLIEDGYTDFFAYSTGRRHVESLHTIFKMRPRHDLAQYLFQLGRTFVDLHYRPVDEVQLDFKLSPTALSDSFVWAVVAKDELISVKEGRWDLVSLFHAFPQVS